MVKAIAIFLLILSVATLFTSPWIAGAAYFLNSLLQPQYIWFWAFSNIPIFQITAGLAIVGAILIFLSKKLNTTILTEKQPIFVLIIWIWMHLSNAFTSYKGAMSAVSPDVVLGTMNSIVIMFIVLLCLCQSEKALKWLCLIFVMVGIYYVYWANSIYIAGDWSKFRNNRLGGPIGSPYSDENVLATLLVTCFPFITILFFKLKNRLLKICTVFMIPLTWHALILCGSRGGFLATIIVLVGLGYVIGSKKMNFLIFASFGVFLAYQGALLLDRGAETSGPEMAQSEKPLNPRLVSWEAALRLIPEYPVFGAGVEKFQAASQYHFPGKTPNVAHNTFLNFSANTGILTGILFLSICYTSIKHLVWAKKRFSADPGWSFYALVSSSLSILGYFVSSIFLDLIIFEPFYLALVINIIAWSFCQREDLDCNKKLS